MLAASGCGAVIAACKRPSPAVRVTPRESPRRRSGSRQTAPVLRCHRRRRPSTTWLPRVRRSGLRTESRWCRRQTSSQLEHVPDAPPRGEHDRRCRLRCDGATLGRREQLGQRLVEVGAGERSAVSPARPRRPGADPRGGGRRAAGRRERRPARLQPLSAQRRSCSRSAPQGKAYFARKHLPTDDDYVFVVVYSRSVQRRRSSTAMAQPRRSSISPQIPPSSRRVCSAPIRVLGDLWFTDAGGNCQDPLGPPPRWCGTVTRRLRWLPR